jgi:hypothetical protein
MRETNNSNLKAKSSYVKANYRNLWASTTGRLTTVTMALTAVIGRPTTVTWGPTVVIGKPTTETGRTNSS